MAKTKEIQVHVSHKLGFLNSYSSVEIGLGETIELEEGDVKHEIRSKAIDRLSKLVVDEAHMFRDKHDKPKE